METERQETREEGREGAVNRGNEMMASLYREDGKMRRAGEGEGEQGLLGRASRHGGCSRRHAVRRPRVPPVMKETRTGSPLLPVRRIIEFCMVGGGLSYNGNEGPKGRERGRVAVNEVRWAGLNSLDGA